MTTTTSTSTTGATATEKKRNPRSIIAAVAARSLGVREVTTNRGPEIAKFWARTSYPEGEHDRQPWCCAAVVAWVQRAAEESGEIALPHPPRMASCAEFMEWARDRKNGCVVFGPESRAYAPLAGDIVCFLPHLSHIGIVERDYNGGGFVETIEGNTNGAGSREGDGVYRKTRALSFCGSFVRLPAVGHEAQV